MYKISYFIEEIKFDFIWQIKRARRDTTNKWTSLRVEIGPRGRPMRARLATMAGKFSFFLSLASIVTQICVRNHRMVQHRQNLWRVPPWEGGGVTGAKYAWTLMLGSWLLNRRMPDRVISWQSYSSTRLRLWQETRWSREASVMSGRLSNSKTFRFSEAQGAMPSCRIPSSVMSSQWERLIDSRRGQHAARTARVASVIWTHSSRSIFSRLTQFLARARNPVSVNCETPEHSSVVRLWQWFDRAISVASDRWQFETDRYFRSWQFSASWAMPTSWMFLQPWKNWSEEHFENNSLNKN